MGVNGANSDIVPLICGVPQGSVIGPQSFPMYVQPVCDILREHNVDYHMYADDLQIMLTCDPMIPGDAECAIFKLSKMSKNGCLQTNWNLTKTKLSFLLLLHVAIIIFWLTYACHLTIPPFSHLRLCGILGVIFWQIYDYGWSCYICMQNS